MLSIEELRKLASLARIEMPDNELEELRGQLDEIIGFVGTVQAADTSGVQDPSSEAVLPKQRNIFRDDGEPHGRGKFSEEIIANFPSSEKGYMKVKKILDR